MTLFANSYVVIWVSKRFCSNDNFSTAKLCARFSAVWEYGSDTGHTLTREKCFVCYGLTPCCMCAPYLCWLVCELLCMCCLKEASMTVFACMQSNKSVLTSWAEKIKKVYNFSFFLFFLLNSYFPSLTRCLNFSCHWQIFSIRLISMIAAHLLNAVFWNVVLCGQAAGVQAVWNTLAQVTQGSVENSAYFLGIWR